MVVNFMSNINPSRWISQKANYLEMSLPDPRTAQIKIPALAPNLCTTAPTIVPKISRRKKFHFCGSYTK